MKILYAIQGTGNGHITAALEVLPHLMKHGQVDILLSGTEADVALPYEIKYRFHGLCFVFGRKGGIDYLETYKKANLKSLFTEIKSLPVEAYDLVFSDFEPVSAWACYLKGKHCIGFSHQAAVVHKASPKPRKKDLIGEAVLHHYAPASVKYGFHFFRYHEKIFLPLIRSEIRRAEITTGLHYTVYLPAFNDKRIIRLLSRFPLQKWEVFSKRCNEAYLVENIQIQPVTSEMFVQSMVSSLGILCGAGFQTPSEALFLQKKLMVVPMKGQYEQQCNAAALKLLGIPVLKNIKPKQHAKIKAWIEDEIKPAMTYPDETEKILEEILAKEIKRQPLSKIPGQTISKAAQFKSFVLKYIFYRPGA